MSPMLRALQIACLSAATATLTLGVLALLTAPSAPPQRLGLRGQKRMQALRDGGGFAVVEPMMRWLSTRVGGLLSPRLRVHLDQQITRAGDVYGLSPEDVLALTLLSGTAGAAVGLIYKLATGGSLLVAGLLVAIAVSLPYLQLNSTAHKRLRGIERDLPQVIDLLVLGLGAGLDFTAAVRQVVDRARRSDEPLIEELGLLLHEFKLGRTRRQGLAKLLERVPCEAVRDVVAAATQSDEQGTPLAKVLATQAAASRQRRSTQAEERAAKVNTSLFFPLVLLFVAILMLIASPMVLQLGGAF